MTDASTPATTSSHTPSVPTAGAGASPDPDWTDQVTDLIVDSVDKVRAKTTGPILEVSQAAVHAVVALLLLVPVAVFGFIGLIRLLDWAIPLDIWVVYAGLGMILVLVGVLLWRLRTPQDR